MLVRFSYDLQKIMLNEVEVMGYMVVFDGHPPEFPARRTSTHVNKQLRVIYSILY